MSRSKYSIAYCAVIEMNEYVRRGDISDWKFRSGDLDFQHSVYDRYLDMNGMQKKRRNPLTILQQVRRSCRHSRDGRKYFNVTGFINYPGISNSWSPVFELKPEYRNLNLKNLF